MWIHTRPASASVSVEVQTPSGDGSDAVQKEFVSFELLATEERDHLDLDTGEVFQNYNYARIRNKHTNLIGATLTIEAASDDSDYKRNSMRYMEEIQAEFFSKPTTIFFTVYLAPTAFRELADNVRKGLLPETITIGFDRDPLGSVFKRIDNPEEKKPLEYGGEPDGSGVVWHNNEKENRIILIDSIKFDYAVAKPRYDETTNQLLPRLPNIPPARMNEQIASIQIVLVELSKHVRWAAIGIIVITVMVAIWMVRHT